MKTLLLTATLLLAACGGGTHVEVDVDSPHLCTIGDCVESNDDKAASRKASSPN